MQCSQCQNTLDQNSVNPPSYYCSSCGCRWVSESLLRKALTSAQEKKLEKTIKASGLKRSSLLCPQDQIPLGALKSSGYCGVCRFFCFPLADYPIWMSFLGIPILSNYSTPSKNSYGENTSNDSDLWSDFFDDIIDSVSDIDDFIN